MLNTFFRAIEPIQSRSAVAIAKLFGLLNLEKLHSLARLGANLVKSGHRVLSHCGMGHNRSALVAGLILMYLGMSGTDAVTLLRQKRQGALYNKVFASYLENLSLVPEIDWKSDAFPIAA